jgi:hypothetical protein
MSDKSWLRSDVVEDINSHEADPDENYDWIFQYARGKFDIAEIYARKVAEEIKATNEIYVDPTEYGKKDKATKVANDQLKHWNVSWDDLVRRVYGSHVQGAAATNGVLDNSKACAKTYDDQILPDYADRKARQGAWDNAISASLINPDTPLPECQPK